MEERLVPVCLLSILIICFLLYAFYSNFIPHIVIEKEYKSHPKSIEVYKGDTSPVEKTKRIRSLINTNLAGRYSNIAIIDEIRNNVPFEVKENFRFVIKGDHYLSDFQDCDLSYFATSNSKFNDKPNLKSTDKTNLKSTDKSNILIEVVGEDIYSIFLPSATKNGAITVKLWNNSSGRKNIKSGNNFSLEGLERSQLITLLPDQILTVTSNGSNWIVFP